MLSSVSDLWHVLRRKLLPFKMELLLLILCLIFPGVISHEKRCESLSIPMCKGIGYNYTVMPNRFHHANQEEASYILYEFLPLKTCSDDLVFFLCSLYAPVCIEDYPRELPPCFSVCVRVRHGCGSIMRKYGFGWPEQMKCGHFPKYGDQENLCMDSKEGALNKKSDSVSKNETKLFKKHTSRKIANAKSRNKQDSYSSATLAKFKLTQNTPFDTAPKCKCECQHPMLPLDNTKHRIDESKNADEILQCKSPCKNPFFNEKQQDFSIYWIGAWAAISCITASITVLTFTVDESRFCYPVRPIIFLSACYIMISMGYLLPFGLGHGTVACDGQIAFNQNAREAPSPSCAVSFLFIYFFTMASSLWWVILGFTWFLAAGLKWSIEAIAGYSHYYHYVAWLLPTAKCITIFWIGAVDGDFVSGVCSVGNQDFNYLRWFLIVPLSFYSALGAVFLIAGFAWLIRIRSVVKKQTSVKTGELEKLILKICVFSFLYLIPVTVHILCLIYEQHFKENWIIWNNCSCDKDKAPEPQYFVFFMLKYCMILIPGFVSVYWIASRKTLKSWYCLFCSYAPEQNSDAGSQRTQSPVIPEVGNGAFELHTFA